MEYKSTLTMPIDTEFTFENFLKIKGNTSAFLAARSFADGDDFKEPSPLVIISPSGMGKTHLLHAISNRIYTIRPRSMTMLTNGETYLCRLKQIEQEGVLKTYRSFLHASGCCLFDNIDSIAGIEQVEQDVLGLRDSLKSGSQKIAFTLHEHPSQIERLNSRLKEWLSNGKIVSIDEDMLSEVNNRKKTIRFNAERYQVQLADDEVEIIANAGVFSFRLLEGILMRIQEYRSVECATVPIEEILKRFSAGKVRDEKPPSCETEPPGWVWTTDNKVLRIPAFIRKYY